MKADDRAFRFNFLGELSPLPLPPRNIFLNVFLALVQSLFVDSRSRDPRRDLLSTKSSVFGRGGGVVGSIGSLKGGGGSWGSWGCHKPGTPSLASIHPAHLLERSEGRIYKGSEREERRRAGGNSERKKVFAKGKKKSLRFSRVVPARGPAGWAGGRAGGQVGRVGWH